MCNKHISNLRLQERTVQIHPPIDSLRDGTNASVCISLRIAHIECGSLLATTRTSSVVGTHCYRAVRRVLGSFLITHCVGLLSETIKHEQHKHFCAGPLFLR